jgi:hypothetical protein
VSVARRWDRGSPRSLFLYILRRSQAISTMITIVRHPLFTGWIHIFNNFRTFCLDRIATSLTISYKSTEVTIRVSCDDLLTDHAREMRFLSITSNFLELGENENTTMVR